MTQRLVDLKPRWKRDGRGIAFLCPCRRHSIVLWFHNPLNGLDTVPAGEVPVARWTRAGEDFETLTLAPSVDVKGCWHGWVLNGEVTS